MWYVVSGFSRTLRGPPEGGHYVHVETALAPEMILLAGRNRPPQLWMPTENASAVCLSTSMVTWVLVSPEQPIRSGRQAAAVQGVGQCDQRRRAFFVLVAFAAVARFPGFAAFAVLATATARAAHSLSVIASSSTTIGTW